MLTTLPLTIRRFLGAGELRMGGGARISPPANGVRKLLRPVGFAALPRAPKPWIPLARAGGPSGFGGAGCAGWLGLRCDDVGRAPAGCSGPRYDGPLYVSCSVCRQFGYLEQP